MSKIATLGLSMALLFPTFGCKSLFQTRHWSWSDNGRLKIHASGDIQFASDDSDLASLSEGGVLEITVRDKGTSNTFKARGKGHGQIERQFNGRDGNTPEAKAWLASVLLDVIRQCGFGAESRAKRILEKDGVDALIQEIHRIESSYIQRSYCQALLQSPKADPASIKRLVHQVGADMDSDYELASLLVQVGERNLGEPVALACAQVATQVDSDYERHRALKALLATEPSEALSRAILNSGQGIDSDYEKSGLIQDLCQAGSANPFPLEPALELAKGMDSDYERGRVLGALQQRVKPQGPALAKLIRCAGEMDSDYEIAKCLLQVAQGQKLEGEAREAYLQVAKKMDSDHEVGRVLKALI